MREPWDRYASKLYMSDGRHFHEHVLKLQAEGKLLPVPSTLLGAKREPLGDLCQAPPDSRDLRACMRMHAGVTRPQSLDLCQRRRRFSRPT